MAATIVRRACLLVLFPVVWLALPLVLDAVLSNAALTRFMLGGSDLADGERYQAALAWFDYLLPLLIGSVISYILALAAYFTVARIRRTDRRSMTDRRFASVTVVAALVAWLAILAAFAGHALLWHTAPNFADRYLLDLLPFAPVVSSLVLLFAFGRTSHANAHEPQSPHRL